MQITYILLLKVEAKARFTHVCIFSALNFIV